MEMEGKWSEWRWDGQYKGGWMDHLFLSFIQNSRSCLQKPVLGWQQGRFSCINLREQSKVQPYFCSMQAMSMVEHLEIPAAQCTNTFLPPLLAPQIHSQAGRKVWVASWLWQSLRLNFKCMISQGQVKWRSTPEHTAVMLFFFSSERLCAKSQPLIQISPSSPQRSSTFWPWPQQAPNENIFQKIIQIYTITGITIDTMSAKTSASLMKSAQIQKTKQTIQQLAEWYSKKEEYFKTYVPIQQTLIKKILNAAEITMNRIKEVVQIVAEEKDMQAFVYEKTEKTTLNDEGRFLPKVMEKVDPKDPKGVAKIQQELPSWSNNIDRVLLSMSRSLKDRKSRIKQIYKTLDSIHTELTKQEQKYRAQLKSSQKELQKLFQRFDDYQKQSSKNLAKIIKQGKGQNLKDSSFFIGQIKSIEKNMNGEFDCFIERNKIIVKLIQTIIKNQKSVAKKMKEQLTVFLTYRRENAGKESKLEEQTWGFLAIAEERIEEERLKYFNVMLLKPEKIELLKSILQKSQFKNNWQIIVKFIETSKPDLMKPIHAGQQIPKLLKNMSYRCWSGISLAQGWLIQSYTPSIMYMTYDYIMIIYNLDGELLKKINTGSSKVNRTEGQTLFLKEKIKGFFSDSLEEYKLRFQDAERMEEFQLFIENQIK